MRASAAQLDRAAGLVGRRLASFRTSLALIADLRGERAPHAGRALANAGEACGGQHGPVRAVHDPLRCRCARQGGARGGSAASTATGLGVDIEADARASPAELAPLFAPRPVPTIRDWVRCESALKADGRGIRVSPADVRLDGDIAHVSGAAPIRVVSVTGRAGTTSALAVRPV